MQKTIKISKYEVGEMHFMMSFPQDPANTRNH